MNKAVLKYEIKDAIFDCSLLFIYGATVCGMCWILDGKVEILVVDAMIFTFTLFMGSTLQVSSINGHSCFGYVRRIQFKNRFIAGVVVAALMALIRTTVLICAHDKYVLGFIEDTGKTADMYNMPFIPEALIANFLIFELVRLLRMISKTTVIYSIKSEYTIVMQERAARLGKNCMFVKVVFFILALEVFVPFVGLYMWMCESLCRENTFLHWAVILGLFIADAILYFVAKKRYSPKYI